MSEAAYSVRFEVLKALLMTMAVLWVVKPCSMVEVTNITGVEE